MIWIAIIVAWGLLLALLEGLHLLWMWHHAGARDEVAWPSPDIHRPPAKIDLRDETQQRAWEDIQGRATHCVIDNGRLV